MKPEKTRIKSGTRKAVVLYLEQHRIRCASETPSHFVHCNEDAAGILVGFRGFPLWRICHGSF
jgi:hypothetical protein